MRIAITGADGYVGGFLCKALMHKGYDDIIRLSLFEKSQEVPLVQTDYSVEHLTETLQDVQVVIHLAARRLGTRLHDFTANEQITENLLQAMTVAKVPRIVYVSSTSVYSDPMQLPWKETQLPDPVTPYGISKLACEYLCHYYERKFGIRYTILRMAHLYGPFDENKRITATFTQQALRGEPLHVYGQSIARREFLFVNDAVAALIWSVENDSGISETLNLGTGIGTTNYEVATVINKAFRNPAPIVYHEELDENIPSSFMDVSALRDRGFTTQYDMACAFREIAHLIQANTKE